MTPDERGRLEDLEAQLRGLPRPQVPPDLADRLIAKIPTGRAAPRDAMPWRWVAVPLVAAAALLIVLLPQPRARDMARRVRSTTITTSKPDTDVIVRSYTKETDPCNILPPLPDWR